ASRTDIFFNFAISSTSSFIGSGQLDGSGVPPNFFADPQVRKAFNYCFDWSAYLKQVQLGEGTQSFDVMLPGEIGYSDQDPHYSYNLSSCQEEFQSATLKAANGHSLWDTGFSLTLPYATDDTAGQVSTQILSQNLKAANPKFVATPKALSGTDWETAR